MMLGRYEVVKHLARGGMAEVFLARATGIERFERHVVLKRIRAEQARDGGHVQMFLDEARLVASLHHHNIVQVHDIGEQQGEYFFVMEYVHGEDLRRLLTQVSQRGERVPLEHVLTIITAAAAGLHHAHEQRGANRTPLGIVHRDVSPENILVGYDGGVKVADFGIAKVTDRALKTGSGILKGKVAYMSPEQCVGLPVDRRTDVFALGIVLYEALTVRRLFKDDNDFLTMTAIVHGQIPQPSSVYPEIPRELEAIVMKALSASQRDRYETADHMRLALEDFAAKRGLYTSATRLADYMKMQFGQRTLPWLVEDDEPDIELSVDGGDSGAEVASAPKDEIRTLAALRGSVPTPPAPVGRPSASESGASRVLASLSRVVPASSGGRRSRWVAASVGVVAVIAAVITLVAERGDKLAAAPAVIQPAVLLAPDEPRPVSATQLARPATPSGSLPAFVPEAPAEILDNAADTPRAPDPVPSQPVKRRHRTPRPEAAKKHWDPHALFPR